jgi:ligand-binding sensor domain-containing protein
MRPFFFLLACALKSGFLLAQTDTSEFPPLRIGEWRQHLPWQRSSYVSQSDSKVYYSTEWAVVEIDKIDRTPRFITKVEGLSDVGINLLRYNKATDALLIAYTNSNLDIYHPSDGTVTNLPFVFKNLNIVGDKKVYSVFFEGKFAYLACGFGVLKLNMERAEAAFTTFTGVVVKSFAVYNNYLYAGTEEGLFRLPASDVNPEDFSRWQMLGAAQGFPSGVSYNALAAWQNSLYMGIDASLKRYDGNTLENITTNPENRPLIYLSNESQGLIAGWKSGFNGKVEYLEPNGQRYEIQGPCEATSPLYAIEDGSKTFWFADDNEQFRYYDLNQNKCDRFTFNSPLYQHSAEIAIERGKVYVSTPGALQDLSPLFRDWGIYIFEDGRWKRFSVQSNPELGDSCGVTHWRVAPHPTEDKFFVGSFTGGLIAATKPGAPTQCYTQYNSILQNAGASGQNRTAIGGMDFDADGNLWMSNYDAVAPIAVLKSDGTLRNFSGAPANNLLNVTVDQNGYKWFVTAFNAGVLVYDSGADLDSPADDRYRLITTSNSELPTNTVYSIAVDLDGDVWIGTQEGVVSFECGSNVFDSNCTGRKRIVTVDGFNAYLLETEEVKTIAVDGANRKWFGTNNGVFVQSPDGIEQVALYTNTNSPLFDNAITDIAIDQQSGEAWIGTEKGIVSLRIEATEGGKINTAAPYAYPNPVRPDYDGPIAIYGLARDANVKITDIAGNLVYEGKALGGQAVWNGRDYLGRRAASGVYLIMATSSQNFDSPDAIITKVVILN